MMMQTVSAIRVSLLCLMRVQLAVAVVETYYGFLQGYIVAGEWLAISGLDSDMLCCFACTKRRNCIAVNYQEEDSVCELVESGDIYTLQNLEAAPEWLLYYADISSIDPKTNATAVQSSTYTSNKGPHYAYTAIDGDYNVAIRSVSQMCAHTKGGPGQWWMVDLKLPFPIQGIVVWNRRDCCSWRLRSLLITVAPTLAGVDDQDSVCAFYAGPPSPLSSNPIQINCASTMRGRYLKIAKQHDEGYLALCEIDLIVA